LHCPSSQPPFLSVASESDDDAPEVITLARSKADARKQEADVQKARNEARRKVKETNRQKDAKLKLRSEETRASREENSQEGLSVVERMERAMHEAAEEEDIGSDEGGGVSNEEDEDSSPSTNEAMEEDKDSEEDSEFGGFDEGEVRTPAQPQRTSNADYLPDEIFEAALSSLAKELKKKGEPSSKERIREKELKKVRRKNKHHESAKDILFGSKIIRMRPSSKSVNTRAAAASRTIPSNNAKHFIQKTLGLAKADSTRVRRNGWERRAANVGSMQTRSALPAARFVRTT